PPAARDLNYRRFFDNNDLVGVRIEEQDVFKDHHALVLSEVRAGRVGGLRVDHPDGLRDPVGYLKRLRGDAPGAWTVVEKILVPGEELAEDWDVEGTTGYDFGRLALGLFVDPAAEARMSATYRSFTGEARAFPQVALEGKRLAVKELLGSDLNRLTGQLLKISQAPRNHRAHTRDELREALAELAAAFPVYRTYLRAGMSKQLAAQASRGVAVAAARVRDIRPDLDPALLTFVEDVLSLRIPGGDEEDLALRFQQLTGAVMAKGVEDTAFYRYHRLISLNEVGDDPGQFGVSLEQFHAAMGQRQRRCPRTMNSTSTHDSKRSEDVRSRINLLSEVPDQWQRAVRRWARLNGTHRRSPQVPDRNFEYLLYQTLVGVWPVTAERLWPVLEKSIREAKLHTSWNEPHLGYEASARRFLTGALQQPNFVDDLSRFVARLIAPARVASLAVALLRCTAPGIPDTYQGTELWEHSLVDPDNRRPVDFSIRGTLLDRLAGMSPEQVMKASATGLPKLLVVTSSLRVRRSLPEAFAEAGDYRPLVSVGKKRDNVVAFCRGNQVVTVVPRLLMQLRSGWEDTVVELPPGHWTHQLTAETFRGGAVPMEALGKRFPVALLVRGDGS
ncbi:MAG: malto-oligosyltrehalose synthase, partial [Candidatus Dormibacteria bacterium]